MTISGVFDLSQTPGSNGDFLGTSVLGTGLVSTADDSFRNLASFLARWRDDLGGVAVTSGNDTITVTANQAFAAYVTGQRYLFKLGGTNTGACTLNITPSGGAALGAKNIKVLVAGVATNPSAGQLTSGNYAEFQYDGTNMNLMASGLAAATNAQAATATSTAVALTPANLAQERGFSDAPFINFAIGTPSVAASALTIPFNGVDGNAFAAANPGYVSFRSATAGSGATAQLALTAAMSLVVSSGSTLGMTSAVAATLALAIFNDAGTARPAIMNVTTGIALPLKDGIASATSEGGAGAADSAGVWYSNAAITAKAYTIVGYLIATEATAGTWATAPATTQVGPVYAANNAVPTVTPWVAYTPTYTGWGTVTGSSMFSRRSGDTLQIMGKATSGTATAVEMRMSLGFNGVDGGLTASSTSVPSIRMVGYGTFNVSGAGAAAVLAESGVAYVTFGVQAAGAGGLTKANGDTFIGTGNTLSFFASIPITGW